MGAPQPSAPAYAAAEARFRRIGLLGGVQSFLDWDTATMMPRGGAEARAEQQAAIAAVVHREVCAPDLGDLLARAADESLAAGPAANLRAMRHRRIHAAAVPERLVEEANRATARCEIAWRDARPANDFTGLKPHLEAVVRLVRERARAKADALSVSPYQALLDEYNPGLSEATVSRFFDVVESFLPDLARTVMKRQAREPKPRALPGPIAADVQRRLGERLMRMLGFDFTHGRLDESRHPFMRGSGDDVRVTMRTDPNDVVSGLLAVAHEMGHALYERGLPVDWRWQPGGEAAGMAMHEAQALLWEMQIVRGRAFLGYFAPILRDSLGLDSAALAAGNLVRVVQHVEPSMIRVDADECTYPLHVLLRYRLETALFDGSLDVADIPGAWNDAMERYIGVRPHTDSEGCMQDIHWMLGNFGYFPSYALGVTAAAQMVAAARRDLGDLDGAVGRGEFAGLLGWLRTHVHVHGSLRSIDELLTAATGRSYDASALEAHLRRRYLAGAT
jgi:carboxypeptidase Taq